MSDKPVDPQEEARAEELQDETPQEPPREEEPPHPGWVTVARLFQSQDPFFENILFLLAYDYSCNIYVLRGQGQVVLVDPGNDYTGLMDLFRGGFCQPEQIRKIVLTHGHRDHSSGALELLRAYPFILEQGGFELILHKEGPEELKKILHYFQVPLTEVEGGEILELCGEPWEVIHTPGHTVDGLCFYHAPSKTAFTGDTVMPHGMAEPDSRAGGRLSHYLYGLRQLLKKDILHVLPGHGFPVTQYGRQVIEQTYESVMLKILGVADKIPWISGAEALARQGLLEEAVFCCTKALAAKPDNFRALQLKAMCLIDLGRGEEALPLLDEMLAKTPEDPYVLTAKGNALLGLARYEESLEYFDRVLRLAPFLKEAKVYKGMALYLLGRYDEAMDIDLFREEFASRFKEELEKLAREKGL